MAGLVHQHLQCTKIYAKPPTQPSPAMKLSALFNIVYIIRQGQRHAKASALIEDRYGKEGRTMPLSDVGRWLERSDQACFIMHIMIKQAGLK